MIKKICIVLPLLFGLLAVNAQQNNTFLWRINNPANNNPSYLFGTIHLPQEKFMSLSDSVYDAVNKTDFFYGELDYANIYLEMYQDDGFFQSKLNFLDSVKKTDSWKRMILSINRHYKVSINPDSLDQFTEFGQNLLGEYMKPDPGVTGLDMALSSYALTLGKKGKGLETYKFQIDMLYKIIEARLTDTTLLFDDDITLTANMKDFYVRQQFDSLSSLIEKINPTYRKIVFDTRNSTMADSIQAISENATAFFAVGCGHLMGPKGILTLLKAKGLKVTPVISANKFSITLFKDLFETGIRNAKKELKKEKDQKITEDEEVKPEDKIEEIKEDVIIAAPKEAVKTPVKKAPVKKTKGKKQ